MHHEKSFHPLSPMRQRSAAAFTLVELLVVMLIMVILMGLLIPVLDKGKNAARKTEAKNDALQIVTAVKHYNTEYGKYPAIDSANSGGSDVLVGDRKAGASPKADNNALFYTLRAIGKGANSDHKLNPKKIVFFERKAASDPAAPKSGFNDKSGGTGSMGSLYDPWGTQYFIMLDSNGDNELDMGQAYSDFSSPDDRPKTGVGVFSAGKDGVLGDAKNGKGVYKPRQGVSDDVISWQ